MPKDRTLTEADVLAICEGLHKNGCLMFNQEACEKLKALADHTTIDGAESVGELGTAIAGEKKFYSKVILRGIVVIVASVVLILFGKNALPLLLK